MQHANGVHCRRPRADRLRRRNVTVPIFDDEHDAKWVFRLVAF